MLRKILFIFSIMSIIILTGCNKSIIEKDLLTKDSEQINIGNVTINNQDKQKYEILDYDECKDVEFIDTCKFVIFEDETAYIIMSYNIADSFRYLADLVEENMQNLTDEQLADANITREKLKDSIKELKEIR